MKEEGEGEEESKGIRRRRYGDVGEGGRRGGLQGRGGEGGGEKEKGIRKREERREILIE